jgi:hypothetical protein
MTLSTCGRLHTKAGDTFGAVRLAEGCPEVAEEQEAIEQDKHACIHQHKHTNKRTNNHDTNKHCQGRQKPVKPVNAKTLLARFMKGLGVVLYRRPVGVGRGAAVAPGKYKKAKEGVQ